MTDPITSALESLLHECIGDAAPGALMGGELRNILAGPFDLAAGDRLVTDQSAQQRGLADAVATEHAGHLARLRPQRDRAQGLRRAVI